MSDQAPILTAEQAAAITLHAWKHFEKRGEDFDDVAAELTATSELAGVEADRIRDFVEGIYDNFYRELVDDAVCKIRLKA